MRDEVKGTVHGILAWATLAVIAGLSLALAYTARTLRKVHASHAALAAATHAARSQGPRGWPGHRAPHGGTTQPGPATLEAAVNDPANGRQRARRPRRAWASVLRVAAVLATTVIAFWVTGASLHWSALAGDAAVLAATTWATRRWR